MIVRCRQCGLEQEARTGIPASKNIPREQGVTVCARCGGIWAEYVRPGIVLGDGRRYLRVRDLAPSDPLLDKVIKHMSSSLTWRAPLRDDPDMLIARL